MGLASLAAAENGPLRSSSEAAALNIPSRITGRLIGKNLSLAKQAAAAEFMSESFDWARQLAIRHTQKTIGKSDSELLI